MDTHGENSHIDLSSLISEYKAILGPRHTSMMVSNKWMPNHDPDDYFLLNCTTRALRLLERQKNSKNEYELNFSTGSINVNGEQKDNTFIHAFLEKLEKIGHQIATDQAQIYFKTKE